MDGFSVKVEEEHEDKPIPLPDAQFQPPVDQLPSLDHEFYEIKVELEDDSIKQEDESIKQEDAPLPQIAAVSGHYVDAQPDSDNSWERLETGADQTGERYSENRRAAEDVGPASADTTEDSYDCTFCGEKFARKPRLSKHILATHLDELLVKCPQCDARFASKRALASHQKFHTGEKLFCCSRCGEAFKYISNYQSHINDHMGTHPYSCGECGAGFSTKRKANVHVDTHHSRFWPYKCEVCLKPFLEKKKFLRHQKKHCVKIEIV